MKLAPALGVVAMAVAGCAPMETRNMVAEAKLTPTQGNQAAGVVTFTQKGDVVQVNANVTGLTPGGHGFHVHEKGDCSAPDASSAGAHFNPTSKPHGRPGQGEHHVGDIPMLEADAGGNARLSVELKSMALREGPTSVVGKSVIVHANPDDYITQPTGNSGGRVACGVIVKR